MDRPPVRLEIRSGNGASYIQEEHEWPVARTEYVRFYLDATPSDWQHDPHHDDLLRLARGEPVQGANVSYSAEVDVGTIGGLPQAFVSQPAPTSTPAWSTGVSFISDPVGEDTVLAGYSKARLWVSSTSADMDIYVSVRMLDEQRREIDYVGTAVLGFVAHQYPVAKGWLKASHRKIDRGRSTEYMVKHTHSKNDYAPLQDGEVVPVEVEIIPNTVLVRAGHRIRMDIQPYDGVDHGTRHAYDPTYHDGAQNTIYTGPEHLSWVQLPVLRPR